jgi:hypothetical protein
VDLLRRRLHALTWLALVGVLALALLPAVSHALAFAGVGGASAEICTPQGLKRIALDADPTPAPVVDHLEHCPFCKLGHDAPPLPPAPPALAEPLPPGPGLPPLFLQAPRTLHAWATAQPRAPPISA